MTDNQEFDEFESGVFGIIHPWYGTSSEAVKRNGVKPLWEFFEAHMKRWGYTRQPELTAEMVEGVRQSLKARREGRVQPWSEVKKELGIRQPEPPAGTEKKRAIIPKSPRGS